ncbi:MAG: DNA polymerase IV [Acidimicrobiia bacterium]
MSFAEKILHADMDAFFVEVERRRQPSLRGRPVVVGGAGRRGVVAAASYEARVFGIHSAMPMSRARSACPDLVIVPPDHAHYSDVSAEVFAIFSSFTPEVEGLSVDEAFLDISGLRRHYSGPAEVGKALRDLICQQLALPVSVGIAGSKLVAKLASEAAKPDGLRLVPVPETLTFLHPLPVRAISGVGEATHAALEALGVATVGDLAEINPELLARRLGQAAGMQLTALARGHDDRPVVSDRQTKSMSVSETYEYDLRSPAQIDTELLRLCDRLGSRLRRANFSGHTVSLTVRYSNFETVVRQNTPSTAVSSAHDLFAAARDLRSQFDWSRPVRLLGVGLARLEGARDFGQMRTDVDPRWDEISGAIANVRERFGADSVGPARLVIREDGSP